MGTILIIGGGPAGVSAALYTARAGIDTTIIATNSSSLIKAKEIENYYGYESPIPGQELLEAGIKQAQRLGVTFIPEEVIGLSYTEKLTVTTKENQYMGDAVIIATGSVRNTPKIKELARFEGAGVSYCAVCDGFFYRGKDVGVLGSGEYAIHEAMELLPVAQKVTLFSNGEELKGTLPAGVSLDLRKVEGLEGENLLQALHMEDGEMVPLSGLFIAQGVAGSTDLARKIGAGTEGNRIAVDAHMATNIPGLYAAGDCTGGLLQVAKAVYEGAEAGHSAIKYIRSLG
jgi:thioredoxin reductase (NADPH)